MLSQGQMSLPFLIYNVITGSHWTLFRFTRFLQGQISLPFSIYNVITRTGSNQSPFLDFHCFYRVKSVSFFRFSVFLQREVIPSVFDLQRFYIISTWS